MRLPYLQVTQETWDTSRALAILLNIDEGAAFKLQCDLWRWGLSLGDEDAPPDGLCLSARADRLLAAAVGWTRDDVSNLVDALADVGLIERRPTGIRVRGMGRYKRTWEKNRRRPARQVPVSGTNPAPPAPEPARQTQTQTQTQTQKESKAFPDEKLSGVPPREPEPLKLVEQKVEKKPRKASLQEQFFTKAQAERADRLRALGLKPEELTDTWKPQRINTQLGEFLTRESWPVWADAYHEFLNDAFAQSLDPPFPMGTFVSQRGRYASQAQKRGAV